MNFFLARGIYPAYLIYMQSTSYEMPGWMKHKLESRLPVEIAITSDTTLVAESEEVLKSLLNVKEESEKPGVELNIKIKRGPWHLVPSLHAKQMGNNENSKRLYFLGLQSHCGS